MLSLELPSALASGKGATEGSNAQLAQTHTHVDSNGAETCNARSPRMTIHHAESTSTAEALLKAQVSDLSEINIANLSNCYDHSVLTLI